MLNTKSFWISNWTKAYIGNFTQWEISHSLKYSSVGIKSNKLTFRFQIIFIQHVHNIGKGKLHKTKMAHEIVMHFCDNKSLENNRTIAEHFFKLWRKRHSFLPMDPWVVWGCLPCSVSVGHHEYPVYSNFPLCLHMLCLPTYFYSGKGFISEYCA